jgi:putative DNA primase/helicase
MKSKNFLAVQTKNVPALLKAIPQWIHWKTGREKPNGRFDKIPGDPNGRTINARQSENWLQFDQAVEKILGHHAGLGFVLNDAPVDQDPNGSPLYLIGIDLDECAKLHPNTPTPVIDERAAKIVETLDSYWEVSPSGTGVRIFALCTTKPAAKNEGGCEVYTGKRFLTVTGRGNGEIKEVSKESLSDALKLMFGKGGSPERNKTSPLTTVNGVNENPDRIAALREALLYIPPNVDRTTWRDVLLAIKAHGFSCGEQLARGWSASAGAYDKETNRNGYDAKSFENVWRCEPHSITSGTLYFYAKKYQGAAQVDHYGDSLNGKVFAELFKNRMKYVYPKGQWIKWEGTHWAWGSPADALESAKHTAEEIFRRASTAFSKDPQSADARKLLAQAQSNFNLKKLESMLICAAAEPDMHVTDINSLDSDRHFLGCQNGVINLKKGQLFFAQPEMLITKRVASTFDPKAKCPLWIDFLQGVTLQDVEMVDYLQRAVGYTLTGDVGEEVLHFAHGFGRNGKSVFANILAKLFADYAVTAPADLLMRRDKAGPTNDIARLVGARLVMANETRNGQAMDDLTLKTLVSTERISARFLHQEFFDFWPTHKIWIRGNHKPLIRDETDGAWRRIRLLPFELSIDEHSIDPKLDEKLQAELPGILAWAVEGCIEWQRRGLQPPQRIRAASNAYRKDCDFFGDFLDEGYVLDASARISQRQLWGAYRLWCEDNGFRSGSKKQFTRRLEDRGVTSSGWQGKERTYSGIRERTASDILKPGKTPALAAGTT